MQPVTCKGLVTSSAVYGLHDCYHLLSIYSNWGHPSPVESTHARRIYNPCAFKVTGCHWSQILRTVLLRYRSHDCQLVPGRRSVQHTSVQSMSSMKCQAKTRLQWRANLTHIFDDKAIRCNFWCRRFSRNAMQLDFLVPSKIRLWNRRTTHFKWSQSMSEPLTSRIQFANVRSFHEISLAVNCPTISHSQLVKLHTCQWDEFRWRWKSNHSSPQPVVFGASWKRQSSQKIDRMMAGTGPSTVTLA